MLNEALAAAVLEIERHVAGSGWDQPARLFALVPTADVIQAVPDLATRLGSPDGHLSSVEQEGFHSGRDLVVALAHLAWPATVLGCALAMERTFLPAADEADLPDDCRQAAQVVARHPHRQELRLVTGVLRDGSRHGVARLRHEPHHLFGDQDLAPTLAAALLATLD